MLTKRTLGVGYLVAVGVGLFGALGTGLLLPVGTRPSASGSVLAVFSLFAVAGGFTLAGVALARGELPGDRVWRVAAWATLGLGVPTLLLLGLGLFRPRALAGMGWRSVAVVDVASGGVVGVLAGMVVELRAERDRARTLDQRNAVFRRLFRHDVRTNVHVVRGHLELLTEAGAAPAASVEAIEDGLDRIERLSEAARRLDELDAAAGDETVDLAALVRDRVATLRERHPAVTVETDVEPATVVATGLLGSVVDNVLENAVEHAGERPTVRVSVAERSGRVELRVRDDGPGFAASELAVHERATETALRHSDGVGLWLARWIVESCDGEIALDNVDGDGDGGAVVVVRLPSAGTGRPSLAGVPPTSAATGTEGSVPAGSGGRTT
jgi:signal transduction histidine kinase